MYKERARERIYLCARCGYCRDMVRGRDETDLTCPLRETTSGFETYVARGKNWILRLLKEGKITPDKLSEKFVDHLYSCLLCGNCTEHCLVIEPDSWDRFPSNKYQDHLINNDDTTMTLRNIVIEEGRPPAEIRNLLENLYKTGNPLGEPSEKRESFVSEVDFPVKNIAKEKADVLLYIGAVAPYNERNVGTIISLLKILKAADVDFGILGKEEIESGGLALELGEEGLFSEFARRNFEIFQKYGIRKVVCLSPHDYYAFLRYYPETVGPEINGIEFRHYTEFILDLIKQGKLILSEKSLKTITFHDPCYLGRKMGIYEEPRQLIKEAGAKLKEMRLSHGNSYCCGGGGGGLWFESQDGPKIENQRARQAVEVKADILAVACPQCAQMLEDGLKSIEGRMQVMDIAEIVANSLNDKSTP